MLNFFQELQGQLLHFHYRRWTLSSYFRALVRLLDTTRQNVNQNPTNHHAKQPRPLCPKSSAIAFSHRLSPIHSEVHSFSSPVSATSVKHVLRATTGRTHRPSLRSDPASGSPPYLPTLACLSRSLRRPLL